MKRAVFMILAVMFGLLSALALPAFSISGLGTVGTTTSANGNQDSPPETLIRSCSDGYTYYIWYDGTNDVYSSTNTPSSPSWSAKTTLLASPYGVQGSAFGGLAFYCDASSNFYIAYSASSGHWSYRAGTLSGGVLTFGAAAVTLVCANANCDPSSVYAFDTTHVWVGVAEIAHQGDVWECQTSACSTAGHWALSTSDSTATFYGGVAVIGLSTNQKISATFCYSACQIETTSNAGSSWSSPVSMPVGVRVSSHIYYLQCLGVSDTTYCGAAILTASNWHPHLLSCAIGCGSWTDKNTTKATSSITTVVLSTDGSGNFILAYQDKTTATTIDSVVTHDSGTTWSALTAITGEATLQPSADPSFQADPSFENSAMALGWEAGASSPYNMRFAETDVGVATSTVTVTCILKSTGAPTETLTNSGGSPSPSSIGCPTGTGTQTVITVTPPCTLTITVAADGANTRYRYNSSATSSTTQQFTCPSGGGNVNKIIWQYYQLQNTYQMTPGTPNTWDASYTEHPTGTVTGVGSSNVCTISLVSSSGAANCSGWADYNRAVSLPSSFASSIAGTWQSQGTNSWTDTTGGNTHNTNYNLLDSVTQKVTIPVDNSGPTGTATISGCDTTAATILMDGIQHTFAADPTCTLTFTVPSDGSNTRYRFSGGSGSTNFMHTTAPSGTESYGSTAYYQLQNTYQMTPSLPSTWDAGYSEPSTGTVVGTGSSTICTITLSNGGGTATCTGWGDYNRAASTPGSFASSVSGTWTAITTNSWSDITGGNTHTATYDLIFSTGFTLTITKNQVGSPTLTFSVTGCAASPSTVTGDGMAHIFSSASGCNVTVQRADSPTDRIRFTNSSANSVVFSVTAGHSYSFTYDYQIFVTVTSNSPSAATTTPSGSAWYTYGTILRILVTILPNSNGLPQAQFVRWIEPNSSTIINNPFSVSTTAFLGGGGDPVAILSGVIYNVVQPNPLTVVFWIFPTIITVFFALLYLVRATRAGATTWARNYMVLTGLVVGILMALVTETMPFPMLLLGLIVWGFFAFRG